MNGTQRTAALFRKHRRKWISAMTLMRVGGWCGFRTRIHECRSILGMRVENKTERTRDGRTRSWYRYLGRAA